MTFVRLGAVDYVPLVFAVWLQALHEREIAAAVTAQKDTIELLMRERRQLLAENASLRRYAGGESEVAG